MIIKFMSFNIQHGRNHKLSGDIIDLPLMAETIQDVSPDFVGLQEIRSGPGGDFQNQPAVLSSITGGTAYFGPATTMGPGNGYGNAVISRLPVLGYEIIPIPDPAKKQYKGYYETRSIMKVRVDCEGKPLTVLISHFGLNPDEQENAVDTVLKIIDSIDTPIILFGDFNMRSDNEILQRLSSRLTDAAAALQNEELTFPSDNPRIRIDYFWYSGVKPVSVQTIKKIASDHFPLAAEFEI